jgi:hypothetical protein
LQFTWLLILLVTIACWAVAARRWWILVALGTLITGVAANQLLWTLATGFVVASGLYRGLSVPFVPTLLAWSVGAAIVIGGRRGAQTAQRLTAAVPPWPTDQPDRVAS